MVKVGDAFKIDVPIIAKHEVKEFVVEQVYRTHAMLSDGIIRVDYPLWDLEHYPQPIRGCWN